MHGMIDSCQAPGNTQSQKHVHSITTSDVPYWVISSGVLYGRHFAGKRICKETKKDSIRYSVNAYYDCDYSEEKKISESHVKKKDIIIR